jgi:enoyl-CoA hydratase
VAHYENLIVEVRDRIGFVTLNRPKVLNVLNEVTVRELRSCFESLAREESVGAILLSGAGDRAFCAGADIRELAEMGPVDGKAKSLAGQAVFDLLESCDKPSLAAINGFAFGGGFEMALACTLRVAASTAKLGLPEVTLAILPGYGGTQRLARVAGPAVAREWTITGDAYPAEEALRVGVVNRVFPPETLLAESEKWLRTILSRGPFAVRCALEAIRRGVDLPLREGERIEADLFGLVATTEDMREGMAAFLEKRPARFTGR